MVWFVLAGVANEVGHGMVGLFRYGRLGSMRFGWARFGMVRQARRGTVRLDEFWWGGVGQARWR